MHAKTTPRRRWGARVVALTLASSLLAACSGDGPTQPQGGLSQTEAQQLASQLAAVSNQPILSAIFLGGNALSMSSSPAGRLSLSRGAAAGTRQLLRSAAIAQSVSPASGMGVPDAIIGKTFAHTAGGWALAANQPTLPAGTVRFLLATASGNLGQLDVTDLTTPGTGIVSYRAVATTTAGFKALDLTLAYSETLVGTATDASELHVTGTLQNPETAIVFDERFGSTGLTTANPSGYMAMHHEVPKLGVVLDLHIQGSGTNEDAWGGVYSVSARGQVLKTTFDAASGKAEVFLNDKLYATTTVPTDGSPAVWKSPSGQVIDIETDRVFAAFAYVEAALPTPLLVVFGVQYVLDEADASLAAP